MCIQKKKKRMEQIKCLCVPNKTSNEEQVFRILSTWCDWSEQIVQLVFFKHHEQLSVILQLNQVQRKLNGHQPISAKSKNKKREKYFCEKKETKKKKPNKCV